MKLVAKQGQTDAGPEMIATMLALVEAPLGFEHVPERTCDWVN